MALNYRARAITKDGQPIFDEFHEHVTLAAWLDANNIFFIHPPNGEWRHKTTAKRLKLMGVKAGAVDFLLFTPSPRLGCPTAIELKALDGKPPTNEQNAFMAKLVDSGWIAGWYRGASAAIEWLESLGYGK